MKVTPDSLKFLGADDAAAFEELLREFITDTGALCTMLVDRTGRMLAQAGDTAGMDGVAFASLASADFAASDQLAELLGEAEFTSLYHHGAERSMFLAEIGGAAILAALFDTRTTLGMVRITTRSLVPRFAECFARLAESGPSGQVVQMETGWANEAESEIDRLFAEE
ncbi:MAG TPA: roadblock/LC7 domain-containing protein [Longimicrobiales bacterium]|nr:roadblock/LC7 domain-containing protein [Longimicrobiales bacterium]